MTNDWNFLPRRVDPEALSHPVRPVAEVLDEALELLGPVCVEGLVLPARDLLEILLGEGLQGLQALHEDLWTARCVVSSAIYS